MYIMLYIYIYLLVISLLYTVEPRHVKTTETDLYSAAYMAIIIN